MPMRACSVRIQPIPTKKTQARRKTVDGIARDIWYSPTFYETMEATEDRKKGECRLCGFQNKESQIDRRHIRQHF